MGYGPHGHHGPHGMGYGPPPPPAAAPAPGSTGVIRGLGAEVGVVVLELLLGEDVAEERLEVQRLAFLSPGRGYLLVDPDLSDTSFQYTDYTAPEFCKKSIIYGSNFRKA